MRKEQILLVVAVGIGGLLIWGATGKYTEVGATTLPAGKDVPVTAADQPNPVKGNSAAPLKGRALWAMVRPEKRAPLPELPAPASLQLFWVKLITTPGAWAEHWRSMRAPIVAAKTAEVVDEAKDTAAAPGDDAPADTPPPDILRPGQKPFNPAKQARLVRVGGEEILCKLEPSGAFKGQPDWVILEKWPNVSFFVSHLNPTKGTAIARNELVGPADLQGYQTVRLAKTLENEFNEERINRRVKDSDRESLTKFAQWVFESLSRSSGADEAPYGLSAVKLAIEELKKANALSSDLTVTRQLGEYCRAAYDLEGELKVYLDYMGTGRTNDSSAQLLVGDAYERVGALEAAKALYAKAAQTGDAEARLRIGLIAEREGDLAAAMTALKGVANVPGTGARALTAMARVALCQGNVAEASTFAEQAKKDGVTPALSMVLGAIQYAQGKAADAANTFATAKEDEKRSDWRSNRGMALVAADKIEDAKKEFFACLESDPLNLVDPYFGLGDAFQRLNQQQRSNDYFETALARAPDNAWVLLRLGTIRLRDGQPEKALAMGLRLLEVAPGCNEGLWLVGRAAASLDKPDFEKAVNYLKRAVDKEPDNRDFIHEHARVLIAAGRMDEALKVLETATSVTTGVGRSDARLLALLSWARFMGKRPIADVFEAIERGKRAQPDDTTKEWLNAVRKIMDDWDRTRIWEDSFDRQASQTILNGWKEADQANGVSVGLDGAGKLIFASRTVKQAAPSREGGTRVFRDEDLGRVKVVEASFKASPSAEMIFHMYLGGLTDRGQVGGKRGSQGGAEIGIGCDRTGVMVLWVTGNAGGKGASVQEWVVKDAAGAPRLWPMDDFHTVKFVRKDDAKGIWEIWLDDEKIAGDGGKTTFEVGAMSMQSGKTFALGFVVDADTGAAVDASVDFVRVTKTNK